MADNFVVGSNELIRAPKENTTLNEVKEARRLYSRLLYLGREVRARAEPSSTQDGRTEEFLRAGMEGNLSPLLVSANWLSQRKSQLSSVFRTGGRLTVESMTPTQVWSHFS